MQGPTFGTNGGGVGVDGTVSPGVSLPLPGSTGSGTSAGCVRATGARDDLVVVCGDVLPAELGSSGFDVQAESRSSAATEIIKRFMVFSFTVTELTMVLLPTDPKPQEFLNHGFDRDALNSRFRLDVLPQFRIDASQDVTRHLLGFLHFPINSTAFRALRI